ncbi:MAG TPA: methyltransferase domain-containing protein [Verrucomicrobiae bacterium]|jgi:SAM-dependent methyltransferase|nr:methyltransferase domain-containing protein [Verrucomicrobiae bacterium]
MKERPNEAAATNNFEFAALGQARNYREALIREFSPFLSGRVIEIGSGIGQITNSLRALPAVTQLQAVEPDPEFCALFRRTLPDQPLIEGTIEDLPPGPNWNAILSINVLEHIRDDEGELRSYYKLLQNQNGLLNLFVPARPEIYARIDKDFGHHRRYTKPELKRKLRDAGFEIVRLRYYNILGYFAWWATFCFLRKRHFGVRSVRFFDRVIFPCVYAAETKILAPPFGQSLLAVARAI